MTTERGDADKGLLQAGIAAMKAHQISRARSLLMRAVNENGNDARAWLCLSRVMRNPAAQKSCLERALALDPALPAYGVLTSTRKRLAARLTKEGIAAARSGERERAHALLRRAIKEDDENPTAWLWLSKTASTARDRTACRQKANSLKAGLRSGLRGRRQPRAGTKRSLGQTATPARPRLAVWLSIACIAIGAALIVGLGPGVARSALARPGQTESATVQDDQPKSSLAAAVSGPSQLTPLAIELKTEDAPLVAAPEETSTSTSPPPATAETPAETQPVQAYTPTRIVVPSVGVDGPVVPIALVADGDDEADARWQVPEPETAGWHDTSAPLGVPGNTVINGHNWPQEAVFRDLYKLQPGEAIIVYADELGFVYEVTEVVLLPEQDQPWEIQLANTHYIDPTDDDRLTIVTCHPYGSVRYRLVVVALRAELAQPDG